MKNTLQKARAFENKYLPGLSEQNTHPSFHLTAGVGWINGPNGFSLYQGEYHLFYQYYPYDTKWGPMHWGHAKSRDLIHWERLPCALAPDMPYDKDGCFSGGAIELPDGRHLLMYTGVRNVRRSNGLVDGYQTQCIAIGDGVDYQKYENNPVLDAKDLPEGGSEIDFRDPKIWFERGKYWAVVGNRPADGSGSILLFESEDDAHRFNFKEFNKLPSTVAWGIDADGSILKEAVEQLHLNSSALPIFLICDSFNRVVFVQQGYTIGIGEQLLKVIHQLK